MSLGTHHSHSMKPIANARTLEAMRHYDLHPRQGESSVLFAPGRAASINSMQLLTVLVVVVELSKETRQQVYSYLYAIQAITHRLRPAILTDGDDLRNIRQYGWVTEHVLSRERYEELEPSLDWEAWIEHRIETSAERLDAEFVALLDSGGVTPRLHDKLMRAMKQSVPYGATRI